MRNRRRGGFQTRPAKSKQTGRFETCPYVRNALLFLPIVFLAGTLHARAELSNGMAAEIVLGQQDFFSAVDDDGNANAKTLDSPTRVLQANRNFLVSDLSNHRVLIWNEIPNRSHVPADLVLGQPNFTSEAANAGGAVSARGMEQPRGLGFDGQRLYVSESINHRVLIWNSIPTKNFTPADLVLGQSNFTASAANGGGAVSSTGFNIPQDIYADEKILVIVDAVNHRVLIWNHLPTSNNAPADIVVGQPDFTSNTANNGGIGRASLNGPVGMTSDGTRLFVNDRANNRLLIWNEIPTQNFTPADLVLGQPDFISGTADNGGVSARSLSVNDGVFTDGQKLFVTDHANSRVLIWSEIPTQNHAPADFVLGQPNFSSNAINNGGINAATNNIAIAGSQIGHYFFMVDFGNHRILGYDLSGMSDIDLGPQFSQGKAVVGKVFWDFDGSGRQN